jgi:hypothetical protein
MMTFREAVQPEFYRLGGMAWGRLDRRLASPVEFTSKGRNARDRSWASIFPPNRRPLIALWLECSRDRRNVGNGIISIFRK